MAFPKSIQNLINYFSLLPTVGPKTAERYVFYLLKQNPEMLQEFAQAIAELKEKTSLCQTCFALAEKNPCLICANKSRDHSLICVAENTRDMNTIENTGQFQGYYHVLGGLIDTINDVRPENLQIKSLFSKLKSQNIKEVVLALSPNLEGETTSLYLTKLIRPLKIKVSRLARGLPTGSNLEYTDEQTLANAIRYRNTL